MKGYCVEARFPQTQLNDERRKEQRNAKKKEDISQNIKEEPVG
jgi:hypothetical protein